MQQPVSRRNVYSPSLSARIGGRDVELVSASMDRSLPDPLAGGSLTAASGELVAVEGANVAQTVATPWDPSSQWPPVPESSASATMDTGAGPVQLLGGGKVTSADGGTSGREVTIGVADRYQTLDRDISWDAQADVVPSATDATTSRYVSLLSPAVTDKILRHCGWYATPPMLYGCTLSVPAMGTMWPEHGTVDASLSTNPGEAFPTWSRESWGLGVSNVSASYTMRGAYSIKSRGRMELAAVTGSVTGGSIYLEVQNAGGLIRLTWSDTRAQVRMTTSSGVDTVVDVARAPGDLAYATIERLTDTRVQVQVRAGVQSASATVNVPSALVTSVDSGAKISSTGGIGGGFQVAYPPSAGSLSNWTANAQFNLRAGGHNLLTALPPVAGENCAGLLAQQCEAESATYWIDETGILRWWDMARLEARGPAATLNSLDDVTDSGFQWSHDLSSVKSGATVKWREPLREWSQNTAIDLWRGSGITLEPGSSTETWINVPDDEIWYMPDTTLTAYYNARADKFNIGYGSWSGGVLSSSDTWAHTEGTLTASLERVNDMTFKLLLGWTGPQAVTLRTVSEEADTPLWRTRRGMDLPIIRGKQRITLGDQETRAAQTGPRSAPEHVIDAGWWIQSEREAQRTADYVAARVTVPQPVLSSIALVPVPGLQLGDTITVKDTHVTSLTIRGLVIGDSRSINADMDMEHAVAIRPLSVTHDGFTWQEWAQVVRPKTWAQWASNQNSTWRQWGNDPLGKE